MIRSRVDFEGLASNQHFRACEVFPPWRRCVDTVPGKTKLLLAQNLFQLGPLDGYYLSFGGEIGGEQVAILGPRSLMVSSGILKIEYCHSVDFILGGQRGRH